MKSLFFLILTILHFGTFEQEENQIEKRVEEFRMALIDPSRENLEDLCSIHLSYGHASGRVENYSQFVVTLISGANDFSSISFEDQSIQVTGNIAIARQTMNAKLSANGPEFSVKMGVMQIWQKENKNWKLIARQAFKIL